MELTKWYNTKEHKPAIKDDLITGGWVLGRYGRNKFATVRYIEKMNRWQNWDYNWAPGAPEYWCYLDEDSLWISLSNYITTFVYSEDPSPVSTRGEKVVQLNSSEDTNSKE